MSCVDIKLGFGYMYFKYKFKFVTGQWNIIMICKLTKRKWVSIETFFLLRRWKSYLGKQQPHWWKKVPNIHVFGAKEEVFSKKAEEQHWVLKAYFTPLLCCPLTNTTHLTHIPVLFCIRKSFCTVINKSLHTWPQSWHSTDLMRGFPR